MWRGARKAQRHPQRPRQAGRGAGVRAKKSHQQCPAPQLHMQLNPRRTWEDAKTQTPGPNLGSSLVWVWPGLCLHLGRAPDGYSKTHTLPPPKCLCAA